MSTPLENVSRIEPCQLEQVPANIADRVTELGIQATRLGDNLPAQTAGDLAGLVRIMNCYYSNLIEGHNTRPRDIERALNQQFEEDARRDLQLEARAHVRVQEAIDLLAAEGHLPDTASVEFVRWVHREFYRDAPESLLRVEHPAGAFLMTPGEFRNTAGQDVVVGRHQPPSSHRVADFMAAFEKRCSVRNKGAGQALITMAIAHHRFNYVHPFPDGNGRVSRLMSHAMALQAGVGAHGLWSISRGLARGLERRSEYKEMMDLADTPRQGDLDGRGNLSLDALHRFVQWFLEVALDQVQFMTTLFDLDGLRGRLQTHVLRDLGLRRECAELVDVLAQRGELSRGDAALAMGLKPRTASVAIRQLVDAGLVVSQSEKGKLRLHYGAASADALFPRLFLTE
jgi:Fic family protein